MLWYSFRLQSQHRVLFSLLLLIYISARPIYLHDISPNAVGRWYQSVRILRASWSGGLRVRILDVVRVLGREGFVVVVGWLVGIVAFKGAFSRGRIGGLGMQNELELTHHQRRHHHHRSLTFWQGRYNFDEVQGGMMFAARQIW